MGITILCDKFNGHPKGYAYIEFKDQESVVNAMILNETHFRGRSLKISPKRSNIYGYNTRRAGEGVELGAGAGGGAGAPQAQAVAEAQAHQAQVQATHAHAHAHTHSHAHTHAHTHARTHTNQLSYSHPYRY